MSAIHRTALYVATALLLTALIPTLASAQTVSFTTIADTTTTSGGAFSDFGLDAPLVNSAGTVVFGATLDAGGEGIFAALSGSVVPFAVVKTGDSLFGSTVSSLEFFINGLNDSNAVALRYYLADDRQGIAVAQINPPVVVPEAGSLVLAAFGLLADAGVVARRKQ